MGGLKIPPYFNMKIDLNTTDFIPDIEVLNSLISEIPEELIYYRYLGPNFRIKGVTLSPFRSDLRPSFGVFFENGRLIYNDFGSEDSGDVYSFVIKYYREVKKLTFLREMINQFRADFQDVTGDNRGQVPYRQSINYTKLKNKLKSDFELEVRICDFNRKHLEYWSKFGITESILKAFNVFPISHYFINGKGYTADPIAFVYIESKDNRLSLKVYQPNNYSFKWISNTDFSVHQGYRMLPTVGELMIITKSLKDVMAIKAILDIPAIGVQGEKSRMKESVRFEYLSRFKHVLCLFDNDKEGKNLSEYFKNTYNMDYIMIPGAYASKDFSDLVKNHGKEVAKELLINLLKEKILKNEC